MLTPFILTQSSLCHPIRVESDIFLKQIHSNFNTITYLLETACQDELSYFTILKLLSGASTLGFSQELFVRFPNLSQPAQLNADT